MRTLLGIIIGYVIFAVSAAALFQLTHQAPHAAASATFIVLTTVYGIVFAALGGYVAQVVARSSAAAPAAGVALLIALGAVVSILATWREAAHWSQWTALLLMAPAANVGGLLRRSQGAARGRELSG